MLLFIDNIFRFTQAGSEVSALLGRMPSAVGYQPNLATEMGELQERITSTKKGSITSVQAIYVPADDLTDPAPATAFAHLDATTVLSRQIAELGIYPAVDPLASTSQDPRSPRIVGEEHYDVRARRAAGPPAVQGPPGHHRDPRHGRALRRGQARRWRARARSSGSCRSRSSWPSSSRARRAGTSSSPTRSRASRRSSTGKHDDLPEQAFYMVGGIEEAREKADKHGKRRRKTFIGHYAVGFAVKCARRQDVLGLLLGSTVLLDLLWPVFLLLGWEEVRVDRPRCNAVPESRLRRLPDLPQPGDDDRLGSPRRRCLLDGDALPHRRNLDRDRRREPLGPRFHLAPTLPLWPGGPNSRAKSTETRACTAPWLVEEALRAGEAEHAFVPDVGMDVEAAAAVEAEADEAARA